MNIAEIRQKFPQYQDIPDATLVRGLHDKFYSDIPYPEFIKKIDFTGSSVDPGQVKSPTEDMGEIEKGLAGAGKAFVDIGRGASQILSQSARPDVARLFSRFAPSADEVKETKAMDAPLMESGSATAGNIVGNIAAMAPAAVMPGANTMVGAGVIGGLTGLLQPVESGGERVKNVAVGTALGAGSQALASAGAKAIANRATSKAAEAVTKQSQNVMRDTVLKDAQAAGYVVPPSAVNPSFGAKRLESVAGKAAIGQEAAVRNQEITNSLARKAIGLADDQPISEAALETFRKQQGQVYNDVSKLTNNASIYLEKLKDARSEAQSWWTHYNRSAEPNSLRSAKFFDAEVAKLEQNLEKEALKAGRPELMPALRQARTAIAKSYDIEKALNIATGDIDARIIGRLLDKKGSKAVTGELGLIGKFANAFSPYAREGSKVPTPGVSKLEALTSLTLGMGGAAAAGPVGALAAAAPLASGPVRHFLLSKLGQAMMAKASYSKAPLTQMAAKALPPDRAALIARSIAAPAYVSGQE